MGIIRWINKVSRVTNKLYMTLIALTIAVLLLTKRYEGWIIGLWSLFILLSLFFSINGYLLISSFNKAVKTYEDQGKPIRGIQGFDELLESLKKSASQSYIVTFSSLLSFGLYIATEPDVPGGGFLDIGDFGSTLALAMVFVSISVMFLVEYPKDPSFTPGGLIGYYEPDIFPLVLDNLLSDVFMTYVDPATFLMMDEWSAGVLAALNPEYENDEIPATRLERAREKIFLLAYLNHSNPDVFNDDVVNRELVELMGSNVDKFKAGKDTGLTWKEVKSIIERIEDKVPDAFRLVDRIMIQLTDNYEKFINEDLYFTVSAKVNQGSVTESSGIIVFFINKTDRDDRAINIRLETDSLSIHPHKQQVVLKLDKMTNPFPKEQPPLVGEGFDILSILSSLLQVGDGVWFRIQPSGFGYRVVSIQAEEVGTNITFGQTFEMRFTKSLNWYASNYLPKLSALGGLALPILKPLIGF